MPGHQVNRIVLAHDGCSAWLEVLPELRASFKHEGELGELMRRAAYVGMQIVAEPHPDAAVVFIPFG